MPSRRPLRAPDRTRSAAAAPATLLFTWQGGAAHLWGWDGRQTMPPGWLDRTVRPSFGWHGSTSWGGRFDTFDLVLPDGERFRPPSVRLSGTALVVWLRSADRRALSSDTMQWLAAVAALATAGVAHGHVTPVVRVEHGRTVARWLPVADLVIDEALADLTSAAPPIALGGGATDVDPAVLAGDLYGALVDAVARQHLADRWWIPEVPRRRAPTTAAVRGVFQALSRPDPLVDERIDADALGAVELRLRRRGQRAHGEPVVLPRLRLVVPDEVDLDWEVRLELVDELDAGRWCSADDVWDHTPLAVELAGGRDGVEVLTRALTTTASTVAGAVDGLAELATQHEPCSVTFDAEAAERFVEQAPAELERLGIELVGPERLVRGGVTVRGRVTPAPVSERPGGVDREAVVDWRLVIADDDGPAALSAAELERAEAAGATLLHTGRRWIRLDPAALRRARRRLEDHAQHHRRLGAAALLRLAADGELDVDTTAGADAPASVDGRPPGRPPRRPPRRSHRSSALRWAAAAVPAAGVGLDAVPRSLGPRRVPRRRHGAGQDGDGAGPPPGPPGTAPRRLPAVGGAQLDRRGGAVHTEPARGRAPRRRPDGQRPGGPRRCGPGRHDVRAAATRRRPPRRDLVVDDRPRRSPGHQEPGDEGGQGRADPARRAEAGAHGHARREPPRPSSGRSSTP